MANYTDDFESYTPGSGLPTGWTSRWDTPTAWAIVDNSGDQSLKITPNTNRCFASNDAINGDANRDNVEILAKFRTTSVVSGSHAHVVARGSGNGTAEQGYVCGILDDDFRVLKYVSGTPTQIGSTVVKNISTSTWYWIRFRVNGTSLKGRIWADGGSEPGTWDIDTTDSAISGTGWAGCFDFFGGTGVYSEWTDVAIATNGDTATMSSSHTVAVGQVSETDTAQSLGKQKLSAVGLVTETETSQAITSAKRLAVGLVSETDSAQALTSAKRVALGQALETGTAQDITTSGATIVSVGIASETDEAFGLTKFVSVGLASEEDSAFSIEIGSATEQSVVRRVGAGGYLVELDGKRKKRKPATNDDEEIMEILAAIMPAIEAQRIAMGRTQ